MHEIWMLDIAILSIYLYIGVYYVDLSIYAYMYVCMYVWYMHVCNIYVRAPLFRFSHPQSLQLLIPPSMHYAGQDVFNFLNIF
jgi:hypothetical protein